jgi:hypothetical protein
VAQPARMMVSSAPPDVSSAKAASRTQLIEEHVHEQVRASHVRSGAAVALGHGHELVGDRDVPLARERQRRIPWGVLEPDREKAHLARGFASVPASPLTPVQIQNDGTRIRLPRQLSTMLAEPNMPQPLISSGKHLQLRIQHRPVPGPRRQTHRKTPHSSRPQLHSHLQRHTTEPHPRSPKRSSW